MRKLGISTIEEKLAKRKHAEILSKLTLVEKLIMMNAKNVYEVVYCIDENIPDEEPNTLSCEKIILANTYSEAIKAAKKKSEESEEIEMDGKDLEITYTNFKLTKLTILHEIDLFG